MKKFRLRFSRSQLCLPYAVFLILFVIAPLLVIFYYAFTNGQGKFTFTNFANFFSNTNTIGTLLYSLFLAFTTTLICLIIAYPTAYILARSGFKKQYVLLMLFIMPMWINFTLRITALKEVLSLIEGNLSNYPFLNSVIGLTYDFLPFMILPLYTSFLKLDKSLMEAASDLGANKFTVFLQVTLPLSVPGIVSGVTMVLLPSMTNCVVLEMLHNKTYNVGSLIDIYFKAFDWHNGSMISLVLLIIIFIVTLVTNRFSDKDNDSRRTLL
ncbi:MAG: ABC transporter permease [Clostridia bacterium]|nr:ABC transporter permease [Clostridia bacterium]